MSNSARNPEVEQAATWDTIWSEHADGGDDPLAELHSLRFKTQDRLVREHLGSFEGLRVIEVGAGQATNALLYAVQGARATALDTSQVALDQSSERFRVRGLELSPIQADVFDLPADLRGKFDVAMSFGLCEHFLGERRRAVVAAHIELLRPGGIAMINVPNRLSPFYRLWMAISKWRGTWSLGTEVPFSGRELVRLARMGGGVPLRPIYLGGLGTLINQGPNAVLARFGLPRLPVPQFHVRGLDYLAYDLLVPVLRSPRPIEMIGRRRPEYR